MVIEHNLEVIKTADWVIDMGPQGGDGGGRVVAAGTPEDVAATKESYTGAYLKPIMARKPAPSGRLLAGESPGASKGGESPGASKRAKRQAAE